MKKAFTLSELLIVILIMSTLYGIHAANTNKKSLDLVIKESLILDMTKAIQIENNFLVQNDTFFTSSTDASCGAGLCYRNSSGNMYARGYTNIAAYTVLVPLSHDNTYALFSTVNCANGSPGIRIRMSNIYYREYNSCISPRSYWTNSSWIKL